MLEIAGLVFLVVFIFYRIGGVIRQVQKLESEISHLRDVCRYLAERRGPT